jgi:glutamine cyclotransferase
VSRRPHDVEAWTQGLQLDEAGRLFESTGLLGYSTLREVDPRSGLVLRSTALPNDLFGEGLALVGDRLVQLTWRQGTASVWDRESFDLLDSHAYEGEGWGLCFDGERLVMSDGSDRLTFRDPASFEVLGEVAVTLEGQPQSSLNELECVDGVVWANVWTTDHIVRIDPSTGLVTGVLDLAPLAEGRDRGRGSVLNGIAYDALAGTYLVTGKLWPELFEIRILENAQG